MKERMIHVVNQTHWDREWYFSTSDSLVLMDQTFCAILDELESNPNINFCFDGQISIIEEYLELYPDKKELIQKLVNEKRLFIGPWYTQTDTQLVKTTSIINNMYYGIYDSLKLFGDYMKVGYLPDTFGFSHQLPMIYHQFDLDKAIFWRGIDFEEQNLTPYFYWKGIDGSRVITANLLKGYAMVQGLNTGKTFIHNVLNPILKRYDELTDSCHLLLPVGGDQNNIVHQIDQKMKELPGQYKISSYEEFLETIKDDVHDEYCGEFRKTKTSRLHKTAGSIRASIKKANYEAEISLIKGLEPLNIIGTKEGFGVSENLIGKAWKLLFEGQAHDGIVGCVSDSVAQDLLNRHKRALEISQSSQNFIKKQLAWSMNLKDDEILIFNTLPFEFHGYKTVEIVSHDPCVVIKGVEECCVIESRKQEGYPNAMVETPDGVFYVKEEDYYYHKVLIKVKLPSLGYKVFKFQGQERIEPYTQSTTISNQDYTIIFENNQLTLKYQDQIIHDFLSLVDQGNDGDTYDFSPLRHDRELTLDMNTVQVEHYQDVQIMTIDCTTYLPYDLNSRLTPHESKACPCQLTLKLLRDHMIYVDVSFDNQVLSHRLRLKVKGYQSSKQTLAASQGGYIIRDVGSIDLYGSWEKTHVEYPVDIEINNGFVGFYGDKQQLFVFNKGLKEYQAIDDAIYLTLFATCGELGKPDLLYRPGRASGETTRRGHNRMMTPLAQEFYVHHYEVAITFEECNVEKLYSLLQMYEEPSLYYQLQNINYFVERIDNKIQRLKEEYKPIPKEKSYLHMASKGYVYGTYTSLYDHQPYIRMMLLNDEKPKEKLYNLLEKENKEPIQKYRIYTIKGEIK